MCQIVVCICFLNPDFQEDSALVAALDGVCDLEDDLGDDWEPCHDDPYAAASLESDDEACLFIM